MTAATVGQARNVRPIDVVQAVADFMPGGDAPQEPQESRYRKFLRLIASHRFWVLVLGLLVAIGLVDAGESDILRVGEAIVTIVVFVLAAVGTKVEVERAAARAVKREVQRAAARGKL